MLKQGAISTYNEMSYKLTLLLAETDGSIRFSLGRDTSKADIDYTLKALSQILTKLKKWYTPTPISKRLELK